MKTSILVITHITSNLEYFQRIMPVNKYDLHTADNTVAALKLLKSTNFDLIFYDNSLPDGNSVEFITQIKAVKRAAKTPVIFMIVAYKKDIVQRAYNAGAVDFITKPLYEEEIMGKMRILDTEKVRREVIAENETLQGIKSDLFAQTILQSGAPVFVCDKNGNFILQNNAFKKLLGYSEEEIRLLNINLISHPDDANLELDQMKELHNGVIDSYYTQKRFYSRDKKLVWAAVNMSSLKIDSEEITHYAGILLHIDDLKEKETSLQTESEMFRTLAANENSGVCIFDNRNNLIYCNKAFETMLSYGKGEMYGMHFSSFTHPEDIQAEYDMVDAMNKKRTNSYKMQKRLISKNKVSLWVEISASCIRDTTGEVRMIAAITENIADRKLQEFRLTESENMYRTLVEETDEVIAIVQEWRIQFANTQALKILGYTREEAIGMNFLDIIDPADRDMALKNHTRRMLDEDISPYEIKIITKQGKSIISYVTINKITWNGDKAFLIYITNLRMASKK